MHPDLLGSRATPEQVFGARMESLRPMLLRIAGSRMQSREMAEDVVQDACVMAVGRMAQLDGCGAIAFREWMVRTVLHLCRNALRGRACERRREMRLRAAAADGEHDRHALDEERALLPLVLARAALSRQEELCVRLRLAGQSDESIAVSYGLEASTVRRYVSRAVRKMRAE